MKGIKKGHGSLCHTQSMKYAFIKANQQVFSVTCMFRVLDIKPSSYYDWVSRDIRAQQIYRNQSELLVRVAYDEIEQRYGYERLHSHLIKQGHDISKYMVRNIKEAYGIF